MRNLMGNVTDWLALLSKLLKATKPGGFVEIAKRDIYFRLADNHPMDLALEKWIRDMVKAGRNKRQAFDICDKLGDWIVEAGYTGVRVTRYPVYLSPWLAGTQRMESNPEGWSLVSLGFASGLDGSSLRPMVEVIGKSKQ